MTTQTDLFNVTQNALKSEADRRGKEICDDITANYHKGNPMSVKANAIAHKYKISARQRIIEELQHTHFYGMIGLTCEELEQDTGLSHQTCSARLSELRREGKIKIVGERKTRSGSPASVYQTI